MKGECFGVVLRVEFLPNMADINLWMENSLGAGIGVMADNDCV